MKTKKKYIGNSLLIVLVTFVIAALIFTIQTFGQEVTYSEYPTGASTKAELITGSWILTGSETHVYNTHGLTKWENKSNEIDGEYTWKDFLDIVHTVNSGFKWETPPKSMQPGNFLNIEASYVNNEYSTPSKIPTGIKMFIDRNGINFMTQTQESIEIMKVSKDNKQNGSEVKKGFFTAPKTLFDEIPKCDLVIDCFIGQDHYVTTYTYTYQP